jgi:hypothetical protein
VKKFLIAQVALILIVCGALPMFSQEPQGFDPEMLEMMKKWSEYATPGDTHKELSKYIGDWNTTTKVWMEGQDNPPSESTGTATFAWVLGKRFLQQNFKGSMMGLPMEGIGFLGYDKYKKTFRMSWMDTMSTAINASEGHSRPDGSIHLWGTMDEFLLDLRDVSVRYVYRWVDDDTFVFTVHDFAYPDGKTTAVEVTYKRVKDE